MLKTKFYTCNLNNLLPRFHVNCYLKAKRFPPKILIFPFKEVFACRMVYSAFTKHFWELVGSLHHSLGCTWWQVHCMRLGKQTCPISTVHFALFFMLCITFSLSLISWNLYGCSTTQWPKFNPFKADTTQPTKLLLT